MKITSSKPDSDELTDTSPMPWGKHTGVPMQDVPADYLHYLWTQLGFKNKQNRDRVSAYIKKNLHALQMENPDLIWD